MPRRAIRLAAACLCLAAPVHAQPVKLPIHGLVTMGRLAFASHPGQPPDNSLTEANAHPGLYVAAVILATWTQLEPAPGQFDFSAIDEGLANVRAYNTRYPSTPLHAKLRVFAGPVAPDWAKQLGGGPVDVTERSNDETVGRVWSVPYRTAWATLQQALAARYDANPLLEEVAVSSCATVSAEPMITPLTQANLGPLENGGYSDQAMEACLMGALDDYAPWSHTAIDYTFNPFRDVSGGRPRPDPGFTTQLMQAFRARYGARGVIANHGLTPTPPPVATGLIEAMRRLGPPIEFQTRSPNTDWPGAVQAGEQDGMTELEIWDTRDAGGPAPVGADQLREWRSELTK